MRASKLTRSAQGFTLTELAVVLAIVGILLGSLMYTLSGQTEARTLSETKKRLEDARELLYAYAVVNGRLPCPATAASNGAESIAVPGPGTGGTCSASYDGYLPAVTLGFSVTDTSGFALDAWGNRIRYAVSKTAAPHFTDNVALKANWSTTGPADLDVCKKLTALNQSTCGSADNRAVTLGTVAAVLWSQGKNYASSGAVSIDEKNNDDAQPAYVSRTPSPAGSADGEFDDILVWIPVGMIYSKLISAGVLP